MKIHANSIDIDYRLDGPEDGPVVMLSNSLMSNYTMWETQVTALTHKYRVLRYDQRGHGLSLIHISEPTRPTRAARMPSSA